MIHVNITLKSAFVIALIAILGLAVNPANAQGRQGRQGNQQQNYSTNYLSIPDLTKDQQTKIEQIQTKHRDEIAVLRTKRRDTRDSDEKQQIRNEMDAKNIAVKTAIRAELTSEQQKYFDENCSSSTNCKGNRRGQGFKGKGRKGNCGSGNRK